MNRTSYAFEAMHPKATVERILQLMLRGWRFAAPPVLLALVLEFVVKAGWISAPYLPAPSAILGAIVHLIGEPLPDGNGSILLEHVGHSALRAVLGFFLAAVLGICLGILIGTKPIAKLALTPVLTLMMPIPPIALAPLLIVTLGRGDLTVIIIVWFAAFFPIVYSTMTGVATIDQKLTWVVHTMGASDIQTFLYVTLPGSLPHVVTGLRLGLGLTWRALVAAEMVAVSDWGLGYMVFSAREYLSFEQMYAGIVLLAIGGFVTENLVVGYIEVKTLRKWGYERS